MASAADSSRHDETTLVQRLAGLVAFDTQNPSGDEAPLVEALATELRALGASTVDVLAVGRHRSVFARFGSTPPRWLINAHVDTVPANDGYSRSPFALTRVGDRCHGLGSADTKGAIAASLEAVAMLRARGERLDGFAVLYSGDEEQGGTCVRAFLDAGLGAGLTHGVACEPTGCRVGTRHRGIAAATATMTAPGGHSSLADQIPSPIGVLARAAVALDEFGQRQREVGPPGFPGLCLNIAGLAGGLAFNVIPARGELAFSFRPGPGADTTALLAETERITRAAVAPHDVVWAIDHANPPFGTRDVQAFAPLLAARGEPPIDLGFWTEAALFSGAGIDAVVFGPGHIEQAHAADEYVTVTELMLARDTFARLLSGRGSL